MQQEIGKPEGADKRPARRKQASANPRDDTDSDSSVQVTSRTIAAKARPKAKTSAWRRKSDNPNTAEPTATETASGSTDPKRTSNKQPTVRRPARQETSQRAKEMLADADAARRVFERMKLKLTWFRILPTCNGSPDLSVQSPARPSIIVNADTPCSGVIHADLPGA